MPIQYTMRGYSFLDDAYTGGGGFLDGTYLLRHPREDDAKIAYRQELSYYSNFVKPVVDSLTNPIFRKMIARDWTKSKSQYLAPFMHDVDRLGSTMNRFMKNAARYARLYGSVFIMVDNSRDISGNTVSLLGERKFPYLYFVKPSQVIEYKSDEHGKLLYIKYRTYETCTKIMGGVNLNTDENVWEWWRDRWKVTYCDGRVDEDVNHLGFIPMVTLYGTDADTGDFMPLSPMMSIARTNLAIYNICSELRELLRNQAFSILCFPITEEVSIEKLQSGIRLGSDNMLIYDGNSSKAPFFISPSADQANLLQDEINRLVEDIYRQANLTGVASVQQRTSGVARQWDFEQTNQALADMAENCEIAEREIVKCFCAYTGEDTNMEYKVIYPRDFGIVDVSGELDKVAAALSLNVGSEFDKQVKIKATEAFLSNIPDKEYDKVVEQIRANADDELYSKLEGEENEGTYNPVSPTEAPQARNRIGEYLDTVAGIKARYKGQGDK